MEDRREGMNLLMQSKNDEFNNYNFAASKIYQEYSKSLRPTFFGSPEIEVLLFLAETFNISGQAFINSSKTSNLVMATRARS